MLLRLRSTVWKLIHHESDAPILSTKDILLLFPENTLKKKKSLTPHNFKIYVF
ncbi:hypothetical protein HanIR_Chr02g0084321 [Helianthus annuus]|nr:hypothetical protein HanIR_Chr02g0084321 [Helianthus annuus]